MKLVVQVLVLIVLGFMVNVMNPSKNEFIDFASAQIKKKPAGLVFTAEKHNG